MPPPRPTPEWGNGRHKCSNQAGQRVSLGGDDRAEPRKETILDHFLAITAGDHHSGLKQRFRDFGAKRNGLPHLAKSLQIKRVRYELTLGFTTQNVMGMGTTKAEQGRHDIVCLQETHAEAAEVPQLQDAHCRNWGFDPRQRSGPMSLWSQAIRRKGGLAVFGTHMLMGYLRFRFSRALDGALDGDSYYQRSAV